ncbi:MAG TPA: two-component regulator propeller domain-containing protein, partial [Bryobacteraceae bacterium]|nr:two-component regulator propeller domain-containing protein [Bryobacteraceae bacterium]
MRLTFVTILLWLSNWSLLHAGQFETEQLSFRRLGGAQGLSQSVIRCIVQDRTGYMWFGTQDGLNRFDGYTFSVYRHDPESASSLPNNSIAAIYEDHNGTLWIGTSGGGLSRRNAKGSGFLTYQHSLAIPNSLSDNTISFIYEDRSNVLWIGTEFGGLDKFD